MLLALLLIASPAHAPHTPIQCPRWVPNSDVQIPPGVSYEYTPTEEIESRLRCYCAWVKPLERACMIDFSPTECIAKTHAWIDQNFGPPMPPRAQRGMGRNVIVNVHTR